MLYKKSVLRQDIEKRFNINKENYYNICLDKMNSILKILKIKIVKNMLKIRKMRLTGKLVMLKRDPF